MIEQRGFTITELLVAVALAGIASVLMVSVFVYTYGGVVVEQTESNMVSQSQVFLRRVVDDVRVASEVRATNSIPDPYNTSGWSTSDPANILITTVPATDSNNELIFDTSTGYPYYHEAVYFSVGDTMYRRLLTNDQATGHVQIATCPSGTSGCPPDIELVGNVQNLLFEFYDIDNTPTTVPEEARSVKLTINLYKRVYGNDIQTSNSSQVTLRNET